MSNENLIKYVLELCKKFAKDSEKKQHQFAREKNVALANWFEGRANAYKLVVKMLEDK